MLLPQNIIPQANASLNKDTMSWIDAEVYGINKCPKSFSNLFGRYLMLVALNNNPTFEQQQCFLSKLLSHS